MLSPPRPAPRAALRHRLTLAAVGLTALLAAPGIAPAQIAGENVNMVSGTQWPGGDPFLQRQNEPSLAVSSANPLHLLAGANDYRSVDLEQALLDETGDAWLGVFKSFDGGQTWQSVLLPGSPPDGSAEGLASPLRGFAAAADAVVRAGPAGIFYLSGIAFNRGSNAGKVFVARYLDRNDKENGDATRGRDPIQYLDTRVVDSGTAGQFMDKPWIAVGLPAPGAAACPFPQAGGRSVPAGPIYISYVVFTGTAQSSSKVQFTRSLDCGATWETPQKLSEANSLNQGTAVAVDPVSGAVTVAWRRFATASEGDAILVARSTDGGRTFCKAAVVANILNFDQDPGATVFRSEGLPTIAVSVDASGTRSWTHLAWSQRPAAGADGQVVLSTSANGATWSAPAAVDAAPVVDDFGNTFARGHQLMPALTFTQGRLMLVYYDSRLSHTRGYYLPNAPFLPDPLGRFYREYRAPRGERLFAPGLVDGIDVDDAGLTDTRRTLEVRVGQSAPGPAPVFATTRLSRFPFGTRGDEVPGLTAPGYGATLQVVDGGGTVRLLQQLQVNPPNLPLFRKGTTPFMGDYIDIAGSAFVPTAAGGWTFNTAPSAAPVHHAVWTTNQNVRPPADGDWTHYTPVGPAGPSLLDPALPRPVCQPGQEGMRNQDVYTARITDGLAVSSPQNAKPLSAAVTRAFVVSVANATDRERAVRLTAAAPAGVSASFRNDGVALSAFDVAIPARSAIARSIFVRLAGSGDPAASLTVTATEVADDPACLGALPPTCPTVAGGLSGAVVLNPPGASVSLVQPDGSLIDVTSLEVYPPSAGAANVSNANVSNANVSNANVSNANVSNANVSNANVSNTHVQNPDLANVSNANVSNANVSNANVSNANVSNANVSNANVSNAPLADANYLVSNTGNSTHSYHLAIVGAAPIGTPLQLILSKPYTTNLALGCQLYQQPQPQVVASIGDVSGAVLPAGSAFADPNVPDPRVTNATFSLAPGEVIQVTLRGPLTADAMSALTSQLVPVTIPHGGGAYAAPLLVTSDGTALGQARVGVPFSAALQALGGTPPYAWALAAGSTVPPGLSLAPDGTLAGTPVVAGTFAFTVRLSDSATGPGTTQRTVTLQIARGPSVTALSVPPTPAVAFQAVMLTATVSAASPGPGVPAPGGLVTFMDGATVLGSATLLGGTATLALGGLGVGSHALTAAAGGDASYLPSTSSAVALEVGVDASVVALASSPVLPVFGQPLGLTATVSRSPVWAGAPAPTGTVTFFDGPAPLAQAPLASGVASASATGLAPGGHALVAVYGGDATTAGARSDVAPLVVDAAATTTALVALPNPALAGQPVRLTASVAAAPPGAGAPDGTVTFLDGATVLGTAALSAGSAALTVSTLAPGSHAVTAAYGGSTAFKPSRSPALALVISRSAYAFTGFLAPLAAAGTLASPSISSAQLCGSAVPLKWTLKDAGGAQVTALSSLKLLQAVQNTACKGPAPAGATTVLLYSPTAGATGGSTFRYSTSQFVFNWDTSKGASKGCWEIVLTLDDGSPARATIVNLK